MTLEAIASHVRAFVVRHKRVGALAQSLVNRFPVLQDVAARVVRAKDPDRRYAEWIATYDRVDGVAAAQPAFPIITADNTALHAQDAEFLIVVAPNTVLRSHAPVEFGRAVDEHPNATLLYGDDDALGDDGARNEPYFKPDWNPTLLHAQNYIGGAVCVRRASVLAAGGFDESDADPVWSLLLRLSASAKAENVVHIPSVLSHRREPQRHTRDVDLHHRRLRPTGEPFDRVEPVGRRSFRVRYSMPSPPPAVSIVVPTSGPSDILDACLEGLTRRTEYPAVDVNVVLGPDAASRLDSGGVRVLRFPEHAPFNFARTMNWAARQTSSPLLCFVNDDTEVRGADWLNVLVAHVSRPNVAAVGAKLLFPTERIQHGGIVVGSGIVAAHAYRGDPDGTSGYHERALVAQEVSAVTAACMLVRREAFESVGGFDERLAIAFNDIDLCLRLRGAGWRIVWTPDATMYHKESLSLGRHDAREREWKAECELMFERWGRPLTDPHHNPNLSRDALRLWEPR